MMLESSTYNERLSELLAGIADGTIALPAFQRDYDWGPSDAKSMLATVMMGWPAGNLLMLRDGATILEARPFEGGPKPASSTRYLVLDGQQRLTALFQAVYNRGPYVYALHARARAADSVEGLEDSVVVFPRDAWDRHREREVSRADLLPFEAVKDASSFSDWLRRRGDTLTGAQEEEVALVWEELYQRFLHHVADYQLPVTAIDSRSAEDDIARIFERVNRTGLKLGAFDLAVARVYTTDWDLREHWEHAVLSAPILGEYLGEDGLAVLQAIALRELGGVRQSEVLGLDRRVTREHWPAAVAAMETAITFMRDELGVLRPGWTPYKAMYALFTALAMDHSLTRHSHDLMRWFFSRTFALRFDAAANTRTVEDYGLLRKVIGGQRLPMPPAGKTAVLSASRRRNRAIGRGFLCVIGTLDPRDISGVPLRGLLVSGSREAVVASLATRSAAESEGLDPNLALHQIVALRDTAKSLAQTTSEEPLFDVWTEGPESLGQLLPALPLQEMRSHPAALLEERLRLLADFLQQALGQDLVDEAEADRAAREPEHDVGHRSREDWLERLRVEYVLTHASVPKDIVAGEAPLPEDWLQERIKELGLADVFLND
jgi:hypothetical protein